jgi:hypothetical protein
MKNYNGIYLNDQDFDVITYLEEIIGKKIPYNEYNFPISYSCDFGYQASDGKIIALSIRDSKFKYFPNEILNLVNLEVLDWSCLRPYRNSFLNNKITLPMRLSELKNLKTLILINNGLEKIPESIGEIQNLESLNLEINELKIIPESIENLKSLKFLYLANNDLSFLPDAIFKLKNLELLDLNANNIESIPEKINQLENLRDLYIAMNIDTSLPQTLINLKNLKRLCILSDPPYYSEEIMNMLSKLEVRGVQIEK